MTDSNDDEVKHILSQAEYEALLKAPTELSLSTYQEALANKTLLFKIYFFLISGITASYLITYFVGGLDDHLAYGWSSVPEEHQLHKLRFALGFVMLATLHAILLLRQRIYTVGFCAASIVTYFCVSGASRLIGYGAASTDPAFLIIYLTIHVTLIILIMLLAYEDERSFESEWSP
jgi:hypothetical protein